MTAAPPLYLHDPDNFALLEREAGGEMRRVWIWGGAMLMIALVFGGISFVLAVANWQAHNLLMQSGVTVPARVVQLRISGGRNPTYSVTYVLESVELQASESAHTRTQAITAAQYTRLPEGTQVWVRYLPPDLDSAELLETLPATQEDRTKTLLLVGAGFLGIPTVIAIALLLIARNRRRTHIVAGRIIGVNEIAQDGGILYLVRYTFQTPRNRAITDMFASPALSGRDRLRPYPGMAVAVAYTTDSRYTLL